LTHTDGQRLVRTGWFREFVRVEQDPKASATDIRTRMQSAGWQPRSATGRVKATCPNRPDTRVWPFYYVPADWPTQTAGDAR
jgi:hypothetical protein